MLKSAHNKNDHDFECGSEKDTKIAANILLTTTALVAFAGAAAADGHVTMSWSGTATAGVAREGGADAGTAAASDATDFDPAGTAVALAIALG